LQPIQIIVESRGQLLHFPVVVGVEKDHRNRLHGHAVAPSGDPDRLDRRPGPRVVRQCVATHRYNSDRGAGLNVVPRREKSKSGTFALSGRDHRRRNVHVDLHGGAVVSGRLPEQHRSVELGQFGFLADIPVHCGQQRCVLVALGERDFCAMSTGRDGTGTKLDIHRRSELGGEAQRHRAVGDLDVPASRPVDQPGVRGRGQTPQGGALPRGEPR
jgi:hypothetical protein